MSASSIDLGPGVVITGMHNSGTAALARFFVALGVDPGDRDELLGAETGVISQIVLPRLVHMNDQILAQLGGTWALPPHDVPALSTPRAAPLRDAYAGVLAELFPAAPWVWQDPRLGLVWPLLARLLDPAPATIVLLRPPWEVAVDLAGQLFDADHSYELWELYTTYALDAMAGPRLVPVLHDDFLDHPRALLTTLAARLGDLGVPVATAGIATLPERLPNPAQAAGRPPVPDSIVHRWREVETWARDTAAPRPGVSRRSRPAIEATRSSVSPWLPARPADHAVLTTDHAPRLDDVTDVARIVAAAEAGEPGASVRLPVSAIRQLAAFLDANDQLRLAAAALASREAPAADQRRTGLLHLLRAHADTITPETFGVDVAQWEDGFVTEVADTLAAPPPAGLVLAPQFWDDPAAPLFSGEAADLALAANAWCHPDLVLGSGAAIEASVLDSTFAGLIDVVAERPTLLVGPAHLSGLARKWRAPGVAHVEIHDLKTMRGRHEITAFVDKTLTTMFADTPPLVLLAVDPVGFLVGRHILEQRPDALVVDVGAVLDIWFEPWRRGHAWFDLRSVDRKRLRM